MTPIASLPHKYASEFAPSTVAVSDSLQSLTWSELEARANQRARLFAELGVRSGDFVTIMLPNSVRFFETTFAVWKLGATPNIVALKTHPVELSHILGLVGPTLVVGGDGHDLAGWKRIDGDAPTEGFDATPLDEPVALYWKAMTSGGSTGRPKVIVDKAPATYDTASPPLLMTRDDKVLNPGPLYHNAPFYTSHTALFSGVPVHTMGKFDAEEVLRLIERHRITFINMVPTMMNRIWALPEAVRKRYDLSSLRLVWHMGSSMAPWLKRNWIEWLGEDRIWELYGGTERLGATLISGAQWLKKPGSVGSLGDLYQSSAIRILAADGGECPPGEVGEIYLLPSSGSGSTYFYLGASAKTAEGGWELTGDLGYLDADGYLFLADRRTDLIIRGGVNVYPAEIEAALDLHPDVDSSVAIGLPDNDLGQLVHVLVETSGVDVDGLARFLAERLSNHKIPHSYECVQTPLRDEAGKVRRSALRDERIRWIEEGRTFQQFAGSNTRAK